MSEAQDAEQEVEDLFNEEILGRQPAPENPPAFPEAPPEPKPVEETADPDIPPEEVQEQEVELPPEPDEVQVEIPPEEGLGKDDDEKREEEPYLAFAKKKYGLTDEQLENEATRLLAKSNYEQERMIGKQAEETRKEREERRQYELQTQIDALHTYGVLTPEEEMWVEERALEGDIDAAAAACFQHNRYDLYAALTDRFVAQGGREAQMANALRARLIQSAVQSAQQEQLSPTDQYRQQYTSIFNAVGLDLDIHGPVVAAKAQELGGMAHPTVRLLEEGDEAARAGAARALYDLASATQTEVARHRVNDTVEARVREEELRRGAAGITQGGTREEPKKKDPFWDNFNEEVEERGWGANGRPTYGRE